MPALASYLRWAFEQAPIDHGYFSLAWDSLWSTHLAGMIGPDYEPVFIRNKPGGLHLYTSSPITHRGPLSLPFGIASPARSEVLVSNLFELLIALVAAWVVWDTARQERQRGWAVGAIVLALALPWIDSGVRWGHADVTLVCLAALVVARAYRSERPVLAGIAFGLGLGASLTMLLFTPMIFALAPGGCRRRALGAAIVVAAVCWGPFIVVDPATLLHMSAPDVSTNDSVWGLLVHQTPGHPLMVARLLQGAAGVVAGVAAYRRRGPATAVVVVGLLRVGMDAATWSYMLLLLVTAGVCADLMQARNGKLRPVNTLGCLFVMVAPLAAPHSAVGRCVLRELAVLTILAVVLRRTPAGSRVPFLPSSLTTGQARQPSQPKLNAISRPRRSCDDAVAVAPDNNAGLLGKP